MEVMINEIPTEKQAKYAADIAKKLRIRLPREFTKQAYSQFISENVDTFKLLKGQSTKQKYYMGVDEDDGWTYGSCLEDII